MSFSGDVSKWTKETKRQHRNIVSTVFIRLATRIISRTPIGDKSLWSSIPDGMNVLEFSPNYKPGSLVNNWQAGIGKGDNVLPVNPPNVTAANALGSVKIIAKQAPGKVAFLANPMSYARRIEYGYSTQAPQGMVRLTVLEFQSIVKEAVRNAT